MLVVLLYQAYSIHLCDILYFVVDELLSSYHSFQLISIVHFLNVFHLLGALKFQVFQLCLHGLQVFRSGFNGNRSFCLQPGFLKFGAFSTVFISMFD